MIDESTTLRELAFIVCTALDHAGSQAVLTGGGAATVYAPETCQSLDIDFVFSFWSAVESVSANPLFELGFERENSLYRHPKNPITVEFPAGPLKVGADDILHWDTLKENSQLLHILTPTDCVRDRLAWYLFADDYASLEQAVSVALKHQIDLELVGSWCAREGESKKFEAFLHRLRNEEA